MTSYDATALFPSVPITDAIEVIRKLLKNDPTLKTRTNLDPDDICDLISLCLSTSNFIYNERHHTQKDSGPIGLSLMVKVSQIWMIHSMEKAIDLAKARGTVVPRLITIYMDDVWCLVPHRRPGLRSSTAEPTDPAVEFNNCLNDVHPRVQFTREDELEGSIAFLDVLLKRQDNRSISTSIYRKPSNTNITIKLQSCQHPSTSIANFKGELCRAYRLCSSPEQVKKEIANGHNRKTLEKSADSYTPPTLQKHNEKRENSRQKGKNHDNNHNTDIPHNLFDVLPFAGVNLTDDAEKNRPYVIVNYIPGPIYHQLKRACTKAGVTLVTRS